MKKYMLLYCLLLLAADSLMAQKMGMKKPVLDTQPVSQVSLELSPNPARDWVDIRINLPDIRGFTLEVFDKNGIRRLSMPWAGESINTSSLQPGLYVIRLKRNREYYAQKLIVDR